MAEYIERETAVKAVMAAKWVDGSDGAMAMEIVASPAAADVAPVVRCKDCKHEFGGSCIICGFQKRKPDDFCSYGERKGKNETERT